MHVAQAVRQMGLRHAVVTTVVRDDLPDSGAGHIAETIRAIRDLNPATTVEVLVSDFRGDGKAIDAVLDAGPEVFGHNIETVRRLYPRVRDRRFAYDGALRTLLKAREYSQRVIVKSALMVGHGETHDDVTETLRDLRGVGVDVVCIGQYLQPSPKQADVVEYVHPDAFEEYKAKAYEIGFEFVVSGPFVRSSYRSEEVLETAFARERLGLTATPAGRR